MAVFKGRGCVTLFRTKEDKGVAFGSLRAKINEQKNTAENINDVIVIM